MLLRTLLLLVLLPAPVSAVVCKLVDADGQITYAEVPAADCPEAVHLLGVGPASDGGPTRRTGPDATGDDDAAADIAYLSLEITAPKAGATVRSNEGQVFISVKAVPTLLQGHTLRIFIDERAIPKTFPTPSVELRNVQRGAHTLRTAIVDANGAELIGSQSVPFTLRAAIPTPSR